MDNYLDMYMVVSISWHISCVTKVCRWGIFAVGKIARNNVDNKIALRDHIDVIVRALGQHIDNAEVGSSSLCLCQWVMYFCTNNHC